MKKFSLRVNGTRIGEAARPVDSSTDLSVQATHRLPTRRAFAPRPGLVVRDYRDEDTNGEVG